MPPTSLPALGEFGLIERIVQKLGDAAARDIVVPPGDDAAVWRTPDGAAAVATIDVLIEGNHWRRDTMSFADVGWRAVAANVSDLAAMGADPGYLLVGLTLAPDVSAEDLDALVTGLGEASRAHHVRVAGGDIVAGTATSIAIAAYGTATTTHEGQARVMRRDAARPGDHIAVTGVLGAAATGLVLIETGRTGERGAEPLVRQHRRPRARFGVGRAAADAGVACAIDVSDGLLQDLGHIARASRVGIEVSASALPIASPAVELVGERIALDLALGGGEDFELALCAPEERLRAIAHTDVPLTTIGRVIGAHPGEVVVVGESGQPYEPPRRGWDQLRHR